MSNQSVPMDDMVPADAGTSNVQHTQAGPVGPKGPVDVDPKTGFSDDDIGKMFQPDGEAPPEPIQKEESKAPDAQPEETTFDVPGLGKLTAAQIAEYAQAHSKMGEFDELQEQFQTEQQAIEEARKQAAEGMALQEFMQKHPQARERILTALRDAVNDPASLPSNGQQPREGMIPKELDERLRNVESFTREQQVERTRAQIDSIWGDYESKFGDVVTPEFREKFEADFAKMGRKDPSILNPTVFKAMVSERILQVGLPAAREQGRAEAADALKNLPPGARVVPGPATRQSAAEELPDPRKLSKQQLIDETVRVLQGE